MLKKLLLLLLFIVGLALLLFQSQIRELLRSPPSGTPQLATLSKGTAEIKTAESLKAWRIQTGDAIRDQQILIVTEPARVRFGDGMEVELSSASVAYFENTERGIFVTFRSGDFKSVSTGTNKERVLFIKNGMVLDPIGRQIIQPPLKVTSEKTDEAIVGQDTLSDHQIANTMATLRQPLLKCYTAHLKDDPAAKGEIYLTFTIKSSGSVDQVRILQSSLANDATLKCVTEVIERATFEKFKGDPIVVNYPIYFE